MWHCIGNQTNVSVVTAQSIADDVPLFDLTDTGITWCEYTEYVSKLSLLLTWPLPVKGTRCTRGPTVMDDLTHYDVIS